MYYKEYGNTGLKVSAIGLGTMRYNADMVKEGRLSECAQLPLYAFEKGINYWDTAPYYCQDKSEIITGMAVAQLDRKKLVLSSKTNLNTLGENPTRDDFRRRLELSLKRLQTDYLDIYHMWCMIDLEMWQRHMDTIYDFLTEAKREGLIHHIAFSSHMQGNDIEKVVDKGLFGGMLIGYNALNYRFRQSGMKAAHANGMGVVVMNPLGGGVIPQNPELFSYLADEEFTVPQAALRFVASHREVSVALAGCSEKAHVDDAVKAVEHLQEASIDEINEKYKENGISLNNLCTGCGYCTAGCPRQIPIPKYMDAYNHSILTGKKEAIPHRLDWHWDLECAGAKECILCGKCEKACTQHLPIRERMKEIASL